MLKVLKRIFNVLYPDRRPDWEQKRDVAANALKTLRVAPGGALDCIEVWLGVGCPVVLLCATHASSAWIQGIRRSNSKLVFRRC